MDGHGSDPRATGFVEVFSDYACSRGTRGRMALSFPRGATLQGALSVDLACPCCGEGVVIPGSAHYVNEAGQLISR